MNFRGEMPCEPLSAQAQLTSQSTGSVVRVCEGRQAVGCGKSCLHSGALSDAGVGGHDALPSAKLVSSISVLSSPEPTVSVREHNVAGFLRIQEQNQEGIL